MDWAAWGPTIVSIITCVFFAGVLWAQQANTIKRVNGHDTALEENARQHYEAGVKIGKLEAWRDGYAVARSVYDRSRERENI
jgi:hypothetical protein